MAKRRMFSRDVVSLDSFIDMPLSARALYFHLGMEADDDGFLGNPKMIIRSVGCSQGDLEHLIAKGFVYAFNTGVVVITHWNQNNHIQKDRYHPTKFIQEKARIQLVNNMYTYMDTECIHNSHMLDADFIQDQNDINMEGMREKSTQNEMYPSCIQNGSTLDTESRSGQVRSGQFRSGQFRSGQSSLTKPDGQAEDQTDARPAELVKYFKQVFGVSAPQTFTSTVCTALSAGLSFGSVKQAIDDAFLYNPKNPSAYVVKVLQDYANKGGAPMLSLANQERHPNDPLTQCDKDWLEEFYAMNKK